MGDLRRSIDQHDTAASPFVAPQSMADKRLLPGGNISDFIQFTIGKKHEFNRKISRSVVIYPPDEVQQDPHCPDKHMVGFWCLPCQEITAVVCLKNAALPLQMREQGLCSIFFARVKTKKLLFTRPGYIVTVRSKSAASFP